MKIYQFWDGELPSEIEPLTKSWQQLSPCLQYELYNKDKALLFFKENFCDKVYEAVESIRIPAMFCDVFRVAIIKQYGGVYADCGTKVHASFNEYIATIDEPLFIRKHNGWIWNGFLAAKKNDKVISELWEAIEKNILPRKDGNIWSITGPKLFMDVLTSGFLPADIKEKPTEMLEEIKGIKLLEQNKLTPSFRIINNLKHKGPAHWSKMQELMTLYRKEGNDLYLSRPKLDKKLVIHIGQHKTGSTSLQQSLLNSSQHEDANFLYPHAGRVGSGHHLVADILASSDTKRKTNYVSELYDECKKSNLKTVIISSEYFSAQNELLFNKARMNKIWRNLYFITELFEESEIVFYEREIVSSVESRILQAIKSRLCLTDLSIDQFLKNPTLNYDSFELAIREQFSKSSVIRKNFDSLKNELIQDFAESFNLSKLVDVRANRASNYKRQVLEMLEINKGKSTVDEKMKMKSKILVTPNDSKFSPLTELQKEKLKKKFYAS
jgi:hypothetical protein